MLQTMSNVYGLVKLLRPHQWIKNGFVLAPVVFAGQLFDVEAITTTFASLGLFCIASSATYILNDLVDIESDRKHPKKSKTRPLASGIVSPKEAIVLLICLYIFLTLGLVKIPQVAPVIIAYLLLNLAYTFYLKNQPVLDIFTIAIGFVMRVYAGALAIDVPVSSWMFITTLCLALYLASIKRLQEIRQSGAQSRGVLDQYSENIVERFAEMSATGALIFYSLFVVSARPELVISIPFVIFGLFRYWFIVDKFSEGESPTSTLIRDPQLIATIVFWVSVCIWAISQ